MLTPHCSAASGIVVPPSIVSTTRLRKSAEYGFAIHAGLLPAGSLNHIRAAMGIPDSAFPGNALAFNANVLMHLMDGEGEGFSQVYYQIAHECGHVHDRTAFDVAIPGLLQRPYNFGSELARIQFGLGWRSWCEYAAT